MAKKSHAQHDYFMNQDMLISIRFSKNESWKGVRKRFNQGFAPAHLMTLLPGILEKTVPFLNHLDEHARIGEPFRLSDLTTNLTFDIIGTVAMDVDMEAQKDDASQQGEFVRQFKKLIRSTCVVNLLLITH
jgi:cytochrome P450